MVQKVRQGIILPVFSFICLLHVDLFAQTFDDCNESEIDACLLEFAVNRDAFKQIVCQGSLLQESNHQGKMWRDVPNAKETLVTTQFFIIQDQTKKLYRKDWRVIDLTAEDLKFDCWWSEVHRGKDIDNYVDGQKVESGEVFQSVVPFDVWSLAFSDSTSLREGKLSVNRWMEVFNSKKLLAVQESRDFVRGEWAFGPSSRVQAYFSKECGRMPTFVRYFVPNDREGVFSKKAVRAANEVHTEWIKLGDGWVPKKVRNVKEQFSQDAKPFSIKSLCFEFNWEGKLKIEEAFFDHSKFSSKNVQHSIETGIAERE